MYLKTVKFKSIVFSTISLVFCVHGAWAEKVWANDVNQNNNTIYGEVEIQIPPPMTELLKLSVLDRVFNYKGRDLKKFQLVNFPEDANCQADHLNESVIEYTKRLSQIKWNPEHDLCDARFHMEYIKTPTRDQNGVANHSVDLTSALDGEPIQNWAQVYQIPNSSDFVVRFIPTMISLESLESPEHLAAVYMVRVLKSISAIEYLQNAKNKGEKKSPFKINRISLIKTKDNNAIILKLREYFKTPDLVNKENKYTFNLINNETILNQIQNLNGLLSENEIDIGQNSVIGEVLSGFATDLFKFNQTHQSSVKIEINSEFNSLDQNEKNRISSLQLLTGLKNFFSRYQRLSNVRDSRNDFSSLLKMVINLKSLALFYRDINSIREANSEYFKSIKDSFITKMLDTLLPILNDQNSPEPESGTLENNLVKGLKDELKSQTNSGVGDLVTVQDCQSIVQYITNNLLSSDEKSSLSNDGSSLDFLKDKYLILMSKLVEKSSSFLIDSAFNSINQILTMNYSLDSNKLSDIGAQTSGAHLPEYLVTAGEFSKKMFGDLSLPKESLNKKDKIIDTAIFVHDQLARIKILYVGFYNALLSYADKKTSLDVTSVVRSHYRSPASSDEDPRLFNVDSKACPTPEYEFLPRLIVGTGFTSKADSDVRGQSLNIAISDDKVNSSNKQIYQLDSVAQATFNAKLEALVNDYQAANKLLNNVAKDPGQISQMISLISQNSTIFLNQLKNLKVDNTQNNLYFRLIMYPKDIFSRDQFENIAPGGVLNKVVNPLLFEPKADSRVSPLCAARSVISILEFGIFNGAVQKFHLQWGVNLPREMNQPISEFTNEDKGLVIPYKGTNPWVMKTKLELENFKFLKPYSNESGHFALITVDGTSSETKNSSLKIQPISLMEAKIEFGPRMSLAIPYLDSRFKELQENMAKNSINLNIPDYYNSLSVHDNLNAKDGEIASTALSVIGYNYVIGQFNTLGQGHLLNLVTKDPTIRKENEDVPNNFITQWILKKDKWYSKLMKWVLKSQKGDPVYVCQDNETYGPIIDVNNAYVPPIQSIMAKYLGYFNVVMKSGKARIDNLKFQINLLPLNSEGQTSVPEVKMTGIDLQIFPYNFEGEKIIETSEVKKTLGNITGNSKARNILDLELDKYEMTGVSRALYSEKEKGSNFYTETTFIGNGERVMIEKPFKLIPKAASSLCFPLPHNKEVEIAQDVTDSIQSKIPDSLKSMDQQLGLLKNAVSGRPATDCPNCDITPIVFDGELAQ